MGDNITVDYKVLGGRAQEIELDSDSTVGDLKSKIGLTKHTASVNGNPADDNDELSNGDFVTLSEPVKGGC